MRRFREAADAGTEPSMIRLHARRRADQSSVSSCSLPPLSALRTRHNRENLIGCRGREGRPLLPARLKKKPAPNRRRRSTWRHLGGRNLRTRRARARGDHSHVLAVRPRGNHVWRWRRAPIVFSVFHLMTRRRNPDCIWSSSYCSILAGCVSFRQEAC